MNIFYLHENPYLAATYFYDKHKVKMILRVCSNALHSSSRIRKW